MKNFFVSGTTANWANLNVIALKVRNGSTEEQTAIPDNLRLKVTLADNFDALAPSNGVTPATSGYLFRHGKRRHFLLLNEGRVVGWAAFHRTEQSETLCVSAKSEREAKAKATAMVRETFPTAEILRTEAATEDGE